MDVIPGVWAGRLEALGLVELLAGAPDLNFHQRVRWSHEGFRRAEAGDRPTREQIRDALIDEFRGSTTIVGDHIDRATDAVMALLHGQGGETDGT